jgi:2'-5' RNA ligase
MSILAIPVPPEIQEKLARLNVPGRRVDPKSYHITLFQFANPSHDDLSKLYKISLDFLKSEKSFSIELSQIEPFLIEATQEGVPIIVKIKCEALLSFRQKLARQLDQSKIEYKKKYEYTPHITLSYADPKDKDFELKFRPLEFKPQFISYYGTSDFRIPFKK